MNAAGARETVLAAGIPFSALTWGHPTDRPILLIHGVTASAAGWWRVGPALAATGRYVVAVDLPGHGLTGHWVDHGLFRETAADLIAFIRAAGLDRADLQIVAHSWGAMIATNLPAAGLSPSRLVLLDPPTILLADIVKEATEAAARLPASPEAARASALAANPGLAEGDLDATVLAVANTDLEAARQVLLQNGDWDSGLAALTDPAATGLDVRVVRGDPATGGRTPDGVAATFAARYGADHVATIASAPHSPQPTHPDELIAALKLALD
jgi:pimeloyl-ACP methyl ester carboxylesterase